MCEHDMFYGIHRLDAVRIKIHVSCLLRDIPKPPQPLVKKFWKLQNTNKAITFK